MCTNNFYPKISLPTRYSKNSCSLIDQMFCKVPLKEDIEFSSSIIVSRISDHFPCIATLKILKRDTKHPKFTHARPMNDHAIQRFKDDLANSCISSVLNPNLMTDPNTEFEKFEKIVSFYFDKHFPEKTIKVNKYRHKLSKWITSGIIKSIEFRENYTNAWRPVDITIQNVSVWNIILKSIMDISIDVYELLRRNIMQMNFWNIKMISGRHGTPLKIF